VINEPALLRDARNIHVHTLAQNPAHVFAPDASSCVLALESRPGGDAFVTQKFSCTIITAKWARQLPSAIHVYINMRKKRSKRRLNKDLCSQVVAWRFYFFSFVSGKEAGMLSEERSGRGEGSDG
jgi:hypothetical protein